MLIKNTVRALKKIVKSKRQNVEKLVFPQNECDPQSHNYFGSFTKPGSDAIKNG